MLFAVPTTKFETLPYLCHVTHWVFEFTSILSLSSPITNIPYPLTNFRSYCVWCLSSLRSWDLCLWKNKFICYCCGDVWMRYFCFNCLGFCFAEFLILLGLSSAVVLWLKIISSPLFWESTYNWLHCWLDYATIQALPVYLPNKLKFMTYFSA